MTSERPHGHATARMPFRSRETLAVWSLAFLYSALMALVWQKLVLPLMPTLHAGHGLMFNDASIFHAEALAIAERVATFGWSEWRLMPSGEFTGNVGLLAAHYALFGPYPSVFIPLQAGFHALGATLIFAIGRELTGANRSALPSAVAAALFAVQPSALIWYGQNHKDAFLIAGFFMIVLALVRSGTPRPLKEHLGTAGLVVSGLALVFCMRAHMLAVYAACLVGAVAIAVPLGAMIHRRILPFNPVGMIIVCVCLAGAAILAPRTHEFAKIDSSVGTGESPTNDSREGSGAPVMSSSIAAPGMFVSDTWQWKPSALLPGTIDRALARVAAIRIHFLEYGESIGAGSTIDADRRPDSAPAVLAYLPSAALAGLFAPFPNTWGDRVSLPRLVGAVETSLLYLLAPGILLLFLLGGRPDPRVAATLALAIAVVTVLCFVSPNAGTLHRVRYGQTMLVALIGLIGWHLAFTRWLAWRDASGGGGDSGGDAGRRGRGPDLSSLARSGMLVIGLSMLGYLGFLIRDLLMVHRIGFGSGLDGFYLTLALVMFVVSTAILPVGDAIAPRLQSLGPQAWAPWWRMVLRRVSLASAAVCALTWGIATLFGGLDGAGRAGASMLLPTLCLLVALAGPLIVANALLNAAGRAGTAAAAQIVVPVVTIGAMLVAAPSDTVYATAVGMVLGQAANLIISLHAVGGLLRSDRVHERAASAPADGMLRSYGSLALTAAVMNAAMPMNLWFASGLGEGSASVWAVGTKLLQVVAALGIGVLSATFVPYMARFQARGGGARARDDLFPSLVAAGVFAGLLCIAATIYAAPMLAAAAGAWSAGDLDRLVSLVLVAGAQLPALAYVLVLSKFAAASSRPWLGTEAALVGLAVNLGLATYLASRYGLVGLGVAWATATAVSAAWLLARCVRLGTLSVPRAWAAVLVAALPAGVATMTLVGQPAAVAAIAAFVAVAMCAALAACAPPRKPEPGTP